MPSISPALAAQIVRPEMLRAVRQELARRVPFEMPADEYQPLLFNSAYARILAPRIVPFDFKHPDYTTELARRAENLALIRANPKLLPALKAYYRDHPAEFIDSWGVTMDPRNLELNRPVMMPFVLFSKQVEWVDWLVDHWKKQAPGLTEKSRDGGMSWVAMALSCTLCLFYRGVSIGFGSRKEEYIDKIGAPRALFPKARLFMQNLPPEFRGDWTADKNAPHLRINFPETGSNIGGEAGDNIGRGDRTSIYFVDEAAHIEHPDLIEQSLSATTNCRQDVSSVNGRTNPFARKRFGGKIDVFTFHWRDDPRKDDAWYEKKKEELDTVTVAQEIDIDYAASVEGVVIPSAWVQAAVDAHLKLGIKPSGARSGALDVADEGVDLNAFCGAHGILIEHIEEWSGKTGDIFATTQRAFLLCDMYGYTGFKYDADGLGAGVRGDARIINGQRVKDKAAQINIDAFRGSEAVFNPTGEDVKGRKNEDFFANRKAQAWWSLRTRFQNTYRAVVEKRPYTDDNIISISSGAGNKVQKLLIELSQPTYTINNVGKILIDKAPDGTRSPNMGDSVMIRFSPTTRAAIRISHSLLERV
jgi:phage terminase large subunit